MKRKLLDSNLVLYYMDKLNIIKISDELYLKILYKKMFRKELNLENPKTFNEKLQWLKLYDRKDIYTTMVDKFKVKEYVSNIIGREYIIPTLGIYDKFEDIDFRKLPKEFVMKCTHDSNSTIICKDKTTFNIVEAKKKMNKLLKRNYYYGGREWPYKNIKPRIIIEEYIKDKELKDYKIMCFNNKAKFIFVCSNRNTDDGLNIDVFDIEWNKMPFGRKAHPNSKIHIKKPDNFSEMIQLAEKLSNDVPFIRVDFYETNGKTYFGELTFYPAGGFEKFEPEFWDEKLGNLLKL